MSPDPSRSQYDDRARRRAEQLKIALRPRDPSWPRDGPLWQDALICPSRRVVSSREIGKFDILEEKLFSRSLRKNDARPIPDGDREAYPMAHSRHERPEVAVYDTLVRACLTEEGVKLSAVVTTPLRPRRMWVQTLPAAAERRPYRKRVGRKRVVRNWKSDDR